MLGLSKSMFDMNPPLACCVEWGFDNIMNGILVLVLSNLTNDILALINVDWNSSARMHPYSISNVFINLLLCNLPYQKCYREVTVHQFFRTRLWIWKYAMLEYFRRFFFLCRKWVKVNLIQTTWMEKKKAKMCREMLHGSSRGTNCYSPNRPPCTPTILLGIIV